MFGVTKQLIEELFNERGREAPAFLQVKPHDLRGPHPRRLKPYRFVFCFDGEAKLAVDIPLFPPPWGRLIDPGIDPFRGRWTDSVAERVLVVDQSMLGVPDLSDLNNGSDLTRIPDEHGSYVLAAGSFDWFLSILFLVQLFAEFEIFIAVGSYNFGVPGDAEFNYLSREAWLRQMEKANDYYANMTTLSPAGPKGEERIVRPDVNPGWPLHPAPGILNLHGAWGQRFRSRPLGDDEEWQWSRDRKLKATAREIDCTVIPLSRNRALLLHFEMSAVRPPKRWRSRGVEVIEAILQGMRFHGPWPAFEDVPTATGAP